MMTPRGMPGRTRPRAADWLPTAAARAPRPEAGVAARTSRRVARRTLRAVVFTNPRAPDRVRPFVGEAVRERIAAPDPRRPLPTGTACGAPAREAGLALAFVVLMAERSALVRRRLLAALEPLAPAIFFEREIFDAALPRAAFLPTARLAAARGCRTAALAAVLLVFLALGGFALVGRLFAGITGPFTLQQIGRRFEPAYRTRRGGRAGRALLRGRRLAPRRGAAGAGRA